jgi:crotonobetainyl-CoA:carnitine CoA-transferase CaiB-like acyl-CoA transferase
MQPLAGVTVLDFSTLLPGPLASLMLAEAGADVIRIERPDGGDEMRGYEPRFGTDSANFAILNRGKKSIAIDLKRNDAFERLKPHLSRADVLIEQFRPGVMKRLGLDYKRLRDVNPRLIYCSITGFGQDGPRAQFAGHDLNYLALSGLLGMARGADGAPALPFTPVADIAGGSYPAVLNIMLALFARQHSGSGCHLDISMADSVFTLAYWALAQGQAAGRWPSPGGELITGGSPRYQVYATADGGYIAAAPLEQRFWENFCRLIGLDETHANDAADPQATRVAVAAIMRGQPTQHWQSTFEGQDVCCSAVRNLADAVQDPHYLARGLFARNVTSGPARMPSLPLPLAPQFLDPAAEKASPALGVDNDLLDGTVD